MTEFRERLHPAPWLHIVALLALPASMLVLAPVDLLAGAVTGVVISAAVIATLWSLAPVISVKAGFLEAGRARISLDLVGDATVARGADARAQRGPDLDARAWLLLRGDVDPVVRVTILDADDPAPYWLISSRRPAELADALVDGVRA